MKKRSEEDFLKEFDAEIENEDHEDYLNWYEDMFSSDDDDSDAEITKTAPQEMSVPQEKVEPKEASVSQEMDLDSLIGAASELISGVEKSEPQPVVESQLFAETPLMDMMEEEPNPMGGLNLSFGDIPEEVDLSSMEAEPLTDDMFGADAIDPFAELFGDGFGNQSAATEAQPQSNAANEEFIDLSNMADADLMSLLSDGLGDIGEMLTDPNAAMGGVDSFATFAESEMNAQAEAVNPEDAKGKKKKQKKPKKQSPFMQKLTKLLFGEDDEDEDGFALKTQDAPNVMELSEENSAILAMLDAEEKGGKNAKKDSKKKDKKKKEAKPKKEKKPKAPKAPKPKKEKKPKEVDNTPPLPKKPVILVCVMAVSILLLVILGTNLVGYSSNITNAKKLEEQGEYAEAYKYLTGLEIKEKDLEFYNQIAVLAPTDSELKAFEIFHKNNKHMQALDSLICALGRCEVNAEDAELYGCGGKLDILQAKVENTLRSTYGMTYEEAMELYHAKNRDMYTIALNKKLKELGLE